MGERLAAVETVPRAEEDEVIVKQRVGEEDGAPFARPAFQVADQALFPLRRRVGALAVAAGVDLEHEADAGVDVAVLAAIAGQGSEDRPFGVV